MKKIILFLWFGDNEPSYTLWTIENFKKVNPTWEIRYIKYSIAQLSDYKNIDDDILYQSLQLHKQYVIKNNLDENVFGHLSYIVDTYKINYINSNKTDIIVYCDLDCFPIAPFDNFFIIDQDIKTDVVRNGLGFLLNCCSFNQRNLGVIALSLNKNLEIFISDQWCISNYTGSLFNNFIQIYKNAVVDELFHFYKGMLLNESQIDLYKKRSDDFHNMRIAIGDNFCLKNFTPIEHYYTYERSRVNKDFTISKII